MPVKAFTLRSGHLLWAAGMAGTVAALPYFLIGRHSGSAALTISVAILAVSALLLWVAVTLGGRAARHWQLGTPWLDALLGRGSRPADTARELRRALLLGLLLGAATVWLTPRLLPAAPIASGAGRSVPAWAELASALFGGITEELYLVWCFLPVSAVVMQAALRLRTGPGTPAFPPVLFWAANALAALLLGVLHLPGALGTSAPDTGLVLRTLLLYGAPGLVYGWLFRRAGLEMAMLAHLAADLCLHASQVLRNG